MTPADLFKALSEAEQAAYEQQAMEAYDPEIVRASNAKWNRYSAEEKRRIGEEGNAVYRDMMAAMDQDPAREEVQTIVARWHRHMQHFWSPSDDQLLALAQGYDSNPEFRKRFEATRPGLAAYVAKAVAVYVRKRGLRPG